MGIQGLIMFTLPSKRESAIIVLFLGIYAILHGFFLNGDATIGYAISSAASHPSLYASNDLVINGSGNFLFYKLLNIVSIFGNNFVLRDFLISVPLTALVVLAWYNILLVLNKDRKINLLALFFIFFADDKLYLNGMNVPFFSLTSLMSVHFAQLFAFLLFLKNRFVASFALLALTSYFHPASGMVYMAVLFCILSLEAWQKRAIKPLLWSALAGGLLFLPNLYLIKGSLNTATVDTGNFFTIFYQLDGGHSYLEDYFQRGYLYVFAIVMLYIILQYRNVIHFYQQKIVDRFIAISLLGGGLWLLNLYYLHNLSIFYTYFIGRVFYIIRPLLIFMVVLMSIDLIKKNRWVPRVLSGLLILSLFVFSSFGGAMIVLTVLLYYLNEGRVKSIEQRLGKRINLPKVASGKFYVVIAALIVVCSIASLGYRYNNKLNKIYRLARGENLFNFSFDPNTNFGQDKAHPFYGEFVDWAKRFSGKMFIVPPDDQQISTSFRYLTKNSIYVNRYDLGQLSYAPPYYFEGFKRFGEIGVVMRGRGVYDFSGYDTLTIEKAKRLDTDFIVFDKLSESYRQQIDARPVFENKKYIVYQLR